MALNRQRIQHRLPDDLLQFRDQLKRRFGGIFAPNREIAIARAPARLDVMGGIADYSGSIVLESTLKPATIVGVQKRRDRRILIRSISEENGGFSDIFEYHLEQFYTNNDLKSLDTIRKDIADTKNGQWAAYVIGAFAILLNERLVETFDCGANIGVLSNIPFGVGIGSSAALEVATMMAVQHAFSIDMEPFQVARASQIVENRIVGAPCGIMDQVTCALGEQDKLLALRCQPHELLKMIPIPEGFQFVGINSGVRHSVGGSRYIDTRVATFMGRKILFSQIASSGLSLPFGGYLCNIDPDLWNNSYKKFVPNRISGGEFMERYGKHDDPVTQIDVDKYYYPKKRTAHPIMENARVQKFMEFVEALSEHPDEEYALKAGALMYQSHESYGKNCGLGARETNLLVKLVKAKGAAHGLYGAKITGGGSGGTVAILAAKGAEDSIRNIAVQYYDETGIEPDIFFGSSPGALELGVTKTEFE